MDCISEAQEREMKGNSKSKSAQLEDWSCSTLSRAPKVKPVLWVKSSLGLVKSEIFIRCQVEMLSRPL